MADGISAKFPKFDIQFPSQMENNKRNMNYVYVIWNFKQAAHSASTTAYVSN